MLERVVARMVDAVRFALGGVFEIERGDAQMIDEVAVVGALVYELEVRNARSIGIEIRRRI
jgi:hypothetical protein